ncbi:flagellar brake protein [Bdellovibrio svalbardensis]|uniref:PilZ domain-containing protein n=1 Tax=Bdellovibrio svalbardensis TaxID=2972972 RepID=A0ABT6DGF6_9BACT|nr:PilZ domain-containing protein [Bdellovibrio svalbardensis]MDG0815893.1 PilZ domain-containing protein [Bdellovibrio svalbardensis]
MAEQGQVIFKKVGVSDKKMLFREIASDRIQVALKGENDEIFHLIAIQTEKDEDLLCHHTADSKKFERPQKVMVNFPFRSERYFFQSELSFHSGWAVLKIDSDLFQLQRRANARIDLPSRYDAVFTLHLHGGKNYFLEGRIVDVSAGGIKVELPFIAPELVLGEKIKGTMRLGIRRPMEFELEVRFAQKKDLQGKPSQVAGLQFLDVDHTMENRLLSLMMDLQREIFVKYAGKR